MFVFSIKTSKRQIISMIVCVAILIVVLLVAIFWPSGKSASAETWKPVSGASAKERTDYLTGLGYEVEAEPLGVREVLIPDEFDEVFTEYNGVQKEAGMDLEPYRGKRVKVWSYKVTNMPEEGEVRANLYVYKDKIVGGDVSSTALDGFMHGLTKYDATGLPAETQEVNAPAASEVNGAATV